MKTDTFNFFWWPGMFCVIGILIVLYQMFTPPILSHTPGGPIDVQWNNYTLEHTWRWVSGWEHHESLWAPPFFFPAQNTGALSDILLGTGPIYWIWRLGDVAPDTAYQLWLISVLTVNFFAMYELLRTGLKTSRIASSVGAYVFTFGGPIVSQLHHPQLMTQFYSVLVVYGLIRVFSKRLDRYNNRRRKLWLAAIGASVVLQLYATFYVGWFLLFGLIITLLITLIVRPWRTQLIDLIHTERKNIAVVALLSIIALWPMAQHYLTAASSVGLRSFTEVRAMIPQPGSYFYHGPNSWLYGWMSRIDLLDPPPREHEHQIGVGIITLAIAVLGYKSSRRTSSLVLLLTALTVVILTLRIGDNITLWHAIFTVVPGAAALRAVSRIGLLLLLPLSVGLALGIHHFATQQTTWKRQILLLGIIVVVILEQGRSIIAFNKFEARESVRAIAQHVESDCESFYYTTDIPPQGIAPGLGNQEVIATQINAMWASLIAQTPTINGYSGKRPPNWHLQRSLLTSPDENERVGRQLDEWIVLTELDQDATCWISVSKLTNTIKQGTGAIR